MKYVHNRNDPLRAAERHLRESDPRMVELIDRFGPCKLAKRSASHFDTLVNTILDQQLSVKAAQSIRARLYSLHGGSSFEAARLIALADGDIRACGVSRGKIRYIRAAATAVLDATLDLDGLASKDDTTVVNALTELPGVGLWTAEILLMFSYRRFDVLPLGDLALCRAIRIHYHLEADAEVESLRAVAEIWRPYRSIASWYLWAAVD